MQNIKAIYSDILNREIRKENNYEFSVSGNHSMRPLFKQGDILVLKTSKIGRGDIIIFRDGDILCCHRVIGIIKSNNKRDYITKGDYLFYRDKMITEEVVLGKVIGVKRNGKMTRLDNRFWETMGKFISLASLSQNYLSIKRPRNRWNFFVKKYNLTLLYYYRFFLRLAIPLLYRFNNTLN